MEEAQCWTSTKQKNSLINSQALASTNLSYGNSWEERAFVEDKARPLRRCVWSPRSYTCSFCKKEFRVSQALGGHMNVHRKDKARLKQSQTTPNDEILQEPSQISSLVCNLNSDSSHGFLASPPSNSRVSPPSTQVNFEENAFVPNFTYPSVEETCKMDLVSNNIPNFKNDEIKNSKNLESNFKFKGVDLLTSLNWFGSQPKEKDEIMVYKRQRTSTITSFFPKPCSIDRDQPKSEVIEVCSNSNEELDLELRLGGRPNVK